jgi:hypothetical protein
MNLHVYKISERLYRIRNIKKDTVKDCWIKNGEIQIPANIHNTLTPTERQAVEMEIF